MTDFNFDLDNVPEDHASTGELDFIQFQNGQANVPGVIGAGGFFAKAINYSSRLGSKYETIPYTFNNGDTELGFMFPTLNFAVLADVMVWTTGGGDRGPFKRYHDYVDGANSFYQVYALIKEFGDTVPVVLRLHGKTKTVGWKDAIKDFRGKIIRPVAASKKRNIPDYIFWCPVSAGPVQVIQVHNTRVTPPILAIDDFGDMKAVLGQLYIGPELQSTIVNSLWDEAQEWKDGVLNFRDGLEETQEIQNPAFGGPLPPQMPAPDFGGPAPAGIPELDNEIPF